MQDIIFVQNGSGIHELCMLQLNLYLVLLQGIHIFNVSLAHLSGRLMGELIVYQSLWRPFVVRPSTFSNIFSSETAGPIKLKCHMVTP